MNQQFPNAMAALFERDIKKHGETVTMPFMMLHLLAHLEYHLGQVNYHRRLVGNAH